MNKSVEPGVFIFINFFFVGRGLYLGFYQATFSLCYLSHGIASRAVSEKYLI